MDIIFDGQQNSDEITQSLAGIIQLLEERYQIGQFREVHLSLTLVDKAGEDVELVDSETNEPFRTFEVYKNQEAYAVSRGFRRPSLKLVVDNTQKPQG